MSRQYTEVLITPEMARMYLEKNTHNRRLDQGVIARYARAMKEGRWQVNGSTLVFSSNGTVRDGQHRLAGCVLADTPFMTAMVYGVDDDVFTTIDDGKPRTSKDMFDMAQESNTNMLGAALSAIWRYENAVPGGKLANWERMELLREHPGIREAVRVVSAEGRGKLRTAVIAFLYYVGGQVDTIKAEQFIQQVLKGESLVATSPAIHLRNRMLGLSRTGQACTNGGNLRFRFGYLDAIGVKALNAHLKGEPLLHLRFNSNKDRFPDVYGWKPYGHKKAEQKKLLSEANNLFVPAEQGTAQAATM